jgi:hypothetical protein
MITPEQSIEINRLQLTQVLVDVAKRAVETNEHSLAACLLVLAGGMSEGSDQIYSSVLMDVAELMAKKQESGE